MNQFTMNKDMDFYKKKLYIQDSHYNDTTHKPFTSFYHILEIHAYVLISSFF